MKRHAALMLLAGLFTAGTLAADDKEDAVKKDLQRLQGAWSIVKAEKNGKPDPMYVGGKSTIAGNKFTTKHGDQSWAGTLKLDPAKKPKSIVSTYTAGDVKGKTRHGIYEIEGDNFKICLSDFGKEEAPADFAAKGGALLLVFQRAK